MNQRDLSIVIGEGEALRQGFLRFVLEGEGFDVAAEAATVEELSRAFSLHDPDVIVLDDVLGITGVDLAKVQAPNAKIVLVWPADIQPIGADARVEPARVLDDLGSALLRVAGVTPPEETETFERPEWVGRVRKDPATLREKLAARGGTPDMPSVTELQRSNRERQQRAGAARPSIAERPSVTAATAQPIADEPSDESVTAAAPFAGRPVEVPPEPWNRLVGDVALGAAAVAGALVPSAESGRTVDPFEGHPLGRTDAITNPGATGTGAARDGGHDHRLVHPHKS